MRAEMSVPEDSLASTRQSGGQYSPPAAPEESQPAARGAPARWNDAAPVLAGVDSQVQICPAAAAKRQAVRCRWIAGEIVETLEATRIEYRFRGEFHLLAVAERLVRRAGETFVEGLAASDLRDLNGRMSFVPAGHRYCEWHELDGLSRTFFLYLDPAVLPVREIPAPRVLFEDTLILALALKLKELMEASCSDAAYLQAIGVVLGHQLARPAQERRSFRGGLARWQQRAVAEHIEQHLDQPLRLFELARLAHLSPYHFARCFKQSFGVPPHRYHVMRRIERAKTLLANSRTSVTDIGLALGFAETSAFTAAFRKVTGFTPTAFVRHHADHSAQ